MPQTPNENNLNYNASSDGFIADEFFGSFFDDNEEEELRTQWKTISLEEYKKLVQLIPKMEKYRNAAEQKEKTIKLKDSQLKELHRSLKHNWINVSNLSAVSVAMVFDL